MVPISHCYKFYSSNRDWYESEAACLLEGATLASVHSEEEDSFLKDLSGGNSYWIGGYPKDSTWVWSDFSELDYTNYYSTDSGYCLYQSSNYYSYGWTTNSCTSNIIFEDFLETIYEASLQSHYITLIDREVK